jgi:hypothetical protein
MDANYFSAMAGLAGAAIGGLTSFGSTWITQKTQLREQTRDGARKRREQLFVEFMNEASRLFADALTHEKDNIADVVNLYAIAGHMRMVSLPRTIAAAERAIDLIIETYHEPNKTLHELRESAAKGGLDPLRDLGRACRAELATFSSSLRFGDIEVALPAEP